MSIVNKVLILFLISLSLMIFVSHKTNTITQNALESLQMEKYIQVSKELYRYLSNNDKEKLNKKLSYLKYKIIKKKKKYFKKSNILYNHTTKLSSIKILKYEDDEFLLYLSYLDDDILVMDSTLRDKFEEKESLNSLIVADILILLVLLALILKMVLPLKNITKNIKKFGEGKYTSRINYKSNDEIGELSNSFNFMASNIEELIISRQRLLRDIGHELKTPISKSKIAIEMIENSKYKDILRRAVIQMDDMTNELLYLEKLNINNNSLDKKNFNIETLISESLSKLFIDDESLINIHIQKNFTINADLNYLTIALKNIIDNALKYTSTKPIFIEVLNTSILVKSDGIKLKKSLSFYCEAFTKEDNSRTKKGYGLGLSLVKRILDKHNFELIYYYKENFNIFEIKF